MVLLDSRYVRNSISNYFDIGEDMKQIISFKKWVIILYIWIASILLEILFTPSGIDGLGQRLTFFNMIFMVAMVIPMLFTETLHEWMNGK